MTERGFLLQASYRLLAGRPVVHLYGRLESGRTFLVRDGRETPHFFVRADDAARARDLGAGPLSTADRVTFAGEPVVRVEVPVPAAINPLSDRLTAAGITCYETDVRFAQRYLMDRGLRGAVEITGHPRMGVGVGAGLDAGSGDGVREGVGDGARAGIGDGVRDGVRDGARDGVGGGTGDGVDVVFEEPVLAPASLAPHLRVLSFDIETDPQARQLLAISLHGCGASEVLLLTPRGFSCPYGAIPFPTEADLLAGFCRRVRELDPDVLTGWNVIDFDLAVLDRLAARFDVPLEFGRGRGALHVQTARTRWGSSRASVPGRVVLDGIQLMRGASVRMEEYSLDFVARAVLGEGKVIGGHDRADEILRTFNVDRPRFVAYNLTDARLVLQILERLRLIELAVEHSLLTGLTPDRIGSSIAAFEFLYMSELSRRGIVAPNARPRGGDVEAAAPQGEGIRGEGSRGDGGRSDGGRSDGGRGEGSRSDGSRSDGSNEPEPMMGGHVLEPEPGLYRNVFVFDFKSLYPSIIRTFEIDPLGYLAEPGPDEDPIVAPNGAAFRREAGILPGLLDDLFPRREAAKAAGDAVASQAIKILMNSFYGVLGASGCRFHNPEIANAITSFGRDILLWSKDHMEARGYRVVYGDTDSLFVLSGKDDPDEARTAGLSLAESLNQDLAAFVSATSRVESRLTLELDVLYLRLLLLPLRRGTGGARKRYAGLVEEGGARRVQFTGMEVVRRDSTELSKQVQRELYDRLFNDRPVEAYLRQVIADLRAGHLDSLLVYRKALRKDLDAYVATTPPHVAAARKMAAPPGRLISYVVTQAGPEPVGEVKHPLDHEHYVEKQVRPVAEPVLALVGLEFDDLLGGAQQLELF